MKNQILLVALLIIPIVLCNSCSSELKEATSNTFQYNGTQAFLSKLSHNPTSHKSTNRTKSNVDAQEHISNDLTTEYLVETSKVYLEENDVDYSEFFSDPKDPRIAILAMGLAEYERIYLTDGTDSRVGGCILEAVGLRDLGIKGAKEIAKQIGKAILKKAVPYVGWAVFAGELTYCLIKDDKQMEDPTPSKPTKGGTRVDLTIPGSTATKGIGGDVVPTGELPLL